MQNAVQPINNGKFGKSGHQAREPFQNENIYVDRDQPRHLLEAVPSELVLLIDTLVPHIDLARQDGVTACRNRQRAALKAIRHHIC